MKNLTRTLLFLLCILPLAACILVDNVDDIWEQSTVDPALEGGWLKKDPTERDLPIFFTKEGDSYRGFTQYPQNPYKIIRSFQATKQGKVLVVKDSESNRHMLLKYAMPSKDVLELYYPDAEKRDAFLKEFPKAEFTERGNVMIFKNMGAENLAVLKAVIDRPVYWVKQAQYTRIKTAPKEIIAPELFRDGSDVPGDLPLPKPAE